jgi:hypothetical protein
MRKSKFAEIFSTLSKVEQNRFEKWIKSPYHNQQEEVRRLLKYCLTTKIDKWSIEEAYNTVFMNNQAPIQRLRNTISYLQRLLENFLVYEYLEEQTQLKQNILLSICRTRGASKGFQATLRKSERLLESQPYRNIEYYYEEYRLQEEKYHFVKQRKGSRLEHKNIQEVIDSLETHHLANKLKYCVHALTHQRIYNTQYTLHDIQNTLKQVEEKWLQVPAIAVYYYCYQTLVDRNNLQACQQLKNTFLQYWDLFDPQELKDFYLITINFFIKQLNEGKPYAREALAVYQSGLERNVFIDKGYLSRFTYKNIVAVGIKGEQYKWVEWFTNNYAKYLPQNYRETYVKYNQAKLYYQTKDYEKAMVRLRILEPTDRELVIDSKVTLMKIYYELDEHEALEALLDSFSVYIRRSKGLSNYLKRTYSTLIRYIRKLQQYNFYDLSIRQELFTAIQEEDQLPERQWLLEKLR